MDKFYENHKAENDVIREYFVTRYQLKELVELHPEGTDYFYSDQRAWELLKELFSETNNVKIVLVAPGRETVFASWNHRKGKEAGYRYIGEGAMIPFATARCFAAFAEDRLRDLKQYEAIRLQA